MKITEISFKNVRGFKNLPRTEFSKSINVFIGTNNSGKSTILNSILLIQTPNVINVNDITIGETEGSIDLFFEGNHLDIIVSSESINKISFDLRQGNRYFGYEDTNRTNWGGVSASAEPFNLIYPYLSKRKVVTYDETISEVNYNSIAGNFTHLFSKIDRLVTPPLDSTSEQYVNACKDILGFEISTKQVGGGKKAGYFVHERTLIPLTSMGEGVANILGLIVDLCIAKDRIFLIEEPENDIHPKALKSLLNFIIEKSKQNQFFISTHSNIVMKYLGGVNDAKIFNITSNLSDAAFPNLFVSKLMEVSNSPEERRQVLEDLGYDFFDFDIWKGWLFLEEASAEFFIRDFFIDWFVPSLKNKIKTFSSKGVTNIAPKFDDFNRLFVYLHLQPVYKNKAWVLIDEGTPEKEIIEKLKADYGKSGWNLENFSQLSKHDFEEYYPLEFKDDIEKIVALDDKKGAKRDAKKELLEKVKAWTINDQENAKKKFSESASEIITFLEKIEEELSI